MRFWYVWAAVFFVLSLVSWHFAWGGGYEGDIALLNRFLIFVWVSLFFSTLVIGKPTPEPI